MKELHLTIEQANRLKDSIEALADVEDMVGDPLFDSVTIRFADTLAQQPDSDGLIELKFNSRCIDLTQ